MEIITIKPKRYDVFLLADIAGDKTQLVPLWGPESRWNWQLSFMLSLEEVKSQRPRISCYCCRTFSGWWHSVLYSGGGVLPLSRQEASGIPGLLLSHHFPLLSQCFPGALDHLSLLSLAEGSCSPSQLLLFWSCKCLSSCFLLTDLKKKAFITDCTAI